MLRAGARAIRSFWPRPISILIRPRSAPSRPSPATRSRSTSRSPTCTSARSPWRRRARRGRPAQPQHQDPGLGRCGEDLFRRPHHGDGRLERCIVSGVELNRMGQNMHSGPLSHSLAHRRRRQGPIYPERVDPRHLQPLRDGARHQQPAHPEQRDLQHRRSLLLPGRRGSRPATSSSTISASSPNATLTAKPCAPTNLGRSNVASGKNFDSSGQNAKDILIPSDNTVATFWITNPDNIYSDNVAAGSEQIGFWFALPEQPTGAHSKARDQPRPPGRAARHIGSSGATSPIPTSTALMSGPEGPRARWPFGVGGTYRPCQNPDQPEQRAGRNGLRGFHQPTRTAMAACGSGAR